MGQDSREPLIVETEGTCTCDSCGSSTDVAVLYATPGRETYHPDDPEWHGFICSRCAARAIEVTTGFKVVRMVEVMYRQRAIARETKPARPK